VTKWTVGKSGLDFDLQTGDVAVNTSISLGKVGIFFQIMKLVNEGRM